MLYRPIYALAIFTAKKGKSNEVRIKKNKELLNKIVHMVNERMANYKMAYR